MATSSSDYDFRQIEEHWQAYWEREGTFCAEDFSEKPKFYVLDMFPYPSGAGLHVGHPEGYTASDILARYKKACGYNVLHPMGWDAFGLPAEQYAVKTGTHPAVTTRENIARFRHQIERIGFAIDWSREINTTDPAYFRWTQWIFLQLFRKGLAYVDEKPVNWCPALGTVLANEEVIDGKSEVGGHPVERRKLRQWVLRITAYAEELLAGLAEVDWPESTKAQQTNWIGRSEGAEVVFEIDGHDSSVTVFTTRPDTLYGATFMVLAPEHPLVPLITTTGQRAAVEAYTQRAASKSDLDRTDLAKEKTGEFTGAYAINPVNGRKIPVWIADYVLMSYGTGAIMAVPAHDSRDYEFAIQFGLDIIRVISRPDAKGSETPLPFADPGTMVNSGECDDLPNQEAASRITQKLTAAGKGRAAVNYKLRDWLFSRQRYWGEPFPILWVSGQDYARARAAAGVVADGLPESPVSYEENGETWYALPLPADQLPLVLPQTDTYKPSGNGESPLAHVGNWLNVWVNLENGETQAGDAPKPLGSDWVRARRETNTMPQWAGSCWYYLRYCDPHNTQALIDPQIESYWKHPDFYIGGAEHAVLHLLYARFWHRFLHDIGVVSTSEPFPKLFHQGIILGEMEYVLFLDGDNQPVSAELVAQHPDAEKLTRQRLAEADVSKERSGDLEVFVWKTNPAIRLEARAFKMSKSRGNVVNPDEVIDKYGADTLRLYEMFMGPLGDSKPWSSGGIEGPHRFLRRFWKLLIAEDGSLSERIERDPTLEESPETLRQLHETIRKVTQDIEALAFNTAIAQMMIFLKHLQGCKSLHRSTALSFVQLLAPFAPHLSEELWERLGQKPSVSAAPWPTFNPALLVTDEVALGILVNGKPRGELRVSRQAAEAEVLASAREQERVASALLGKTIRKVVYVPGKILNIVAG